MRSRHSHARNEKRTLNGQHGNLQREFQITSTRHLHVIPSNVSLLLLLSHNQVFVTPWSVARQAPLSMGFSRQESWSGLPFPPPGDLPDPGIEPASLVFPALGGGFFTTSATWEALYL